MLERRANWPTSERDAAQCSRATAWRPKNDKDFLAPDARNAATIYRQTTCIQLRSPSSARKAEDPRNQHMAPLAAVRTSARGKGQKIGRNGSRLRAISLR